MNAVRLFAMHLCVLALAAGCATVRRAHEAQDPGKAPAGERTVTAAEIGLTSNTTLTLAEAERFALAYAPAVAQARLNCSNAVEQTRQALAAYLPALGASAGYQRSTANTAELNGRSDSGNAYSADVSLELLLFDFGRTPALVREAAARRLGAEQALQSAENQAALNVRLAFYGLGRSYELLRVADETVRQYEVRREQIRTLVEVGRRIQYDITKADVDLGNARLDRITAANNVTSARAVLNCAMGLAEEPGYAMGAVEAAMPFRADMGTLMDAARRQHPDLRSLRAQVQAASNAVDAAVADLYPSLGLNGAYRWGGASFPMFWNWALGANLGGTLFSGWLKTSQVEGAVIRLRLARSAVAAREQQIHLDLRTALSDFESSVQRMELNTLVVRQARESLDLVEQRYRVGQATAVELTDAQVALTTALANEVKARFDNLEAAARLRSLSGER